MPLRAATPEMTPTAHPHRDGHPLGPDRRRRQPGLVRSRGTQRSVLTLSFSVDKDSRDPLNVYLYDPDQGGIWSEGVDPSESGSFEGIMETGGKYYIMIGEGRGHYELEIE